jgi:WD40 repeat protein
VASRYPLAVDASNALTEGLYRGLLVDMVSLEEAFLAARVRLSERPGRAGWASVQLYARAADGPDHRPIVVRPYRGLLAFHEEHARYFFGREAEVEETMTDLSALIQAKDAAKPRFLIIAGASGTGKSSLVLAGVGPTLRARDGRWVIATLRPHEGWRASLDAALASRPDPGAPLLLIVDQFEELFSAMADNTTREAFVGELWTLASDPSSGVSVIATLRVDFLARCGEIRLEGHERSLEDVAYDEAHRVFVRRMKREHLRRIIEEPARRSGLLMEAGLAEQMLKDAGDEPGALPLLEYALDQVWQGRRGRLLTWERYNHLGGVGGALEQKADGIIGGLDAVRQRAARRLLVQLVTLDEADRFDRRRRVAIHELRRGSAAEAAAFDEVMNALARERLLVVSDGVEVAHEQLLRNWGALRRWVTEAREMLVELRRLDAWAEEAKGFSAYVLDPDRLGHARGLSKAYPDDLSEAARKLIERSEEADREAKLQAARVRDGFLVSGAAELLARRRPRLAAGVLLEVQAPETARGWVQAAHDSLAQQVSIITLRGHEEYVLRAVFSPDGKRIVTASRDGTARVWNADGFGTPILLDHPSLLVREAAFSPDGERIVTQDIGQGRVWNADGSGTPVVIGGSQDVICPAAFSPDGKRIVTGSKDKRARVWNADGAGTPVVLGGHDDEVTSAVFSPDGDRVLTTSKDKTARLWSADGSGAPVVLVHDHQLVSAAFSPTGSHVVTVGRSNDALVWSTDGSGSPVRLSGHTHEVTSAAWSPDGERIVTVSDDGTARVWSASSPDTPPVVFEDYDGHANTAAFSPDGKLVVVACSDGTAHVYGVNHPGTRVVLRGHEKDVYSAQFSPDGESIVTASHDKTARVWKLKGGGDIVFVGNPHGLPAPVFSPDGRRIVTASKDSTACAWDADGKGAPVILAGHEDEICFAAFSPDGERIVTASKDKTARVWKADGTGDPVVLAGHENELHFAAFSPDGKHIVTVSGVSDDWSVSLWDADDPTSQVVCGPWLFGFATFSHDSRKIVSPVLSQGFSAWPVALGVSADGTRHIVAYSDGTARVWSADGTGAPVVLEGHEARVNAAAWSPDGERIVTASADKTARMWNADGTGAPIVLRGHEDEVVTAAFTPDGRHILTASKDGIVRRWEATIEGLKQRLVQVATDCLPPDVRQKYLGESEATARAHYEACERAADVSFFP